MNNVGGTFEYFGDKYAVEKVKMDVTGRIEISGYRIKQPRMVTGYTGACFYHELGSSETKIIGTETKVKLDPDVLTTFDWAYAKQNSKYRIKKIQRNPKKNATTVIFENGHVEVVKRNELDPEADLYSVVAYAVAKYVYGSNSAFKRQIRDCIFESLEVK